jgi:hypothetical protein
VLEAFLQPDIEFPPFAPAETGGRPRARDEDDETSGAPGELWLQMMLQAQAEIGADANKNLPDLAKMGWLPARPRTPDENPQVSPNVLQNDDDWDNIKDAWPPVSNMSFKFRTEAEVFTPEPIDEPGRRNRGGGSRRRKKTTK